MKAKIILLVAVLISMNSVLAFNVYIRPPRMIARMNLTESQIYEGFLEIKNSNDIPVNVTFKPIGNITDLIEFSEDLVILQPNETRKVDFKLSLNEPGYYVGDVIATYTAENTVPIALQADIIVIAEGQPQEKTQNSLWLYAVIVLVVVLVILISTSKIRVAKKKRFRK